MKLSSPPVPGPCLYRLCLWLNCTASDRQLGGGPGNKARTLTRLGGGDILLLLPVASSISFFA